MNGRGVTKSLATAFLWAQVVPGRPAVELWRDGITGLVRRQDLTRLAALAHSLRAVIDKFKDGRNVRLTEPPGNEPLAILAEIRAVAEQAQNL